MAEAVVAALNLTMLLRTQYQLLPLLEKLLIFVKSILDSSKELHSLCEVGALSLSEYAEQKEPILQQLKKISMINFNNDSQL